MLMVENIQARNQYHKWRSNILTIYSRFKRILLGGFFFSNFHTPITQEMNDTLTADVSNEEIMKAIKSIEGDRAPGPDGLSGSFYQQFLSTIGEDLITVVKDFFNNGIILPFLNKTHIFLIPKIDQPNVMSDYFPAIPFSFAKLIVRIQRHYQEYSLNMAFYLVRRLM